MTYTEILKEASIQPLEIGKSAGIGSAFKNLMRRISPRMARRAEIEALTTKARNRPKPSMPTPAKPFIPDFMHKSKKNDLIFGALPKKASWGLVPLNKTAGIGSWVGRNIFGGKAYRAGAKFFTSNVTRPLRSRYGTDAFVSRSARNIGRGLGYMAKNPIKSTVGLGLGAHALSGLVRRPPVQRSIGSAALNWAQRNPVLAGAGILGGGYMLGQMGH